MGIKNNFKPFTFFLDTGEEEKKIRARTIKEAKRLKEKAFKKGFGVSKIRLFG